MKGDLLAVVCALAMACFLGLVAAGAMMPPEPTLALWDTHQGNISLPSTPRDPNETYTIRGVPVGRVVLCMTDGTSWRYARGKWVRL